MRRNTPQIIPALVIIVSIIAIAEMGIDFVAKLFVIIIGIYLISKVLMKERV